MTETLALQLASEANERRRIARSNIFVRAYHAVKRWWQDLDLLGWPASNPRTPWYSMPGGFSAAFAPSSRDPHPDAVGYFARERMINSDPLVLPGDEIRSESESRDDSTWD